MTTKRIENLHLSVGDVDYCWRIEIDGCAIDLPDGKAFQVARIGQSLSISIEDLPELVSRPMHGFVWQTGDDER